MSKLYSRPRSPPSPPPVTHKSSRTSRLDSKNYSEPSSKSYSSSKDYDKYGSYDKYDRSKYEKSDKYDRYDKLEKPSYKSSSSYVSSKDHSSGQYASSILKGASSHSDKYIGKSASIGSSYQEDSYRSKDSMYPPSHSYSDRTAYVSKYPPRSTDKYPSDGKDLSDSKYSRDSARLPLSSTSGSDKKYASYSSVGKTSPYSKYGHESNSYYPKGDSYHSYDSYSRGSDAPTHSGRSKGGGDANVRSYNDSTVRSSTSSTKGYHNNAESNDTYGGGYQRYVIGDSVVYGSPGHYPKDIYPPSPKAKRPRSPQSPPSLLSSSKMASSSSKGYSRYSSSPKRYSNSSSLKGVSSSRDDAAYSRSSHRKPPSPPAIPYHTRRDDRPSRNYTPPPDRGKGFSDRFDYGKGGRYYDERESGLHEPLKRGDPSGDYAASYARRKRDPAYLKPPYPYQDSNSLRPLPNDFHPRDRYPERVPKPLQPPKPLLSIPLSVNSIPKESRANVRETLGLPRSRPLNGLDRGSLKLRRLDGRIGSRKRPLSPKDKRKRRPDDLRLWIESRKTEGKTSGASKSKGQVKRPLRAAETVTRSRILDSRRRILTKGKRKTIGGVVRREPRRTLPPKPKSRDDDSRSNPDGPKKSEAPVNNRDGADLKDSVKDNVSGGSSSGTSKRRKDKKDGGSEFDRDKGSEGTRGGGSSGKGPGSNATIRRAIRRPRIVSQANRLPLKPRALKQRSSRRSPHDRDKVSSSSVSKGEKPLRANNSSSKSKAKERSRSRTRSRSRPSSRARPRSRSRSRVRSPLPSRRTEKEETSRSSSSRHRSPFYCRPFPPPPPRDSLV